MATILRLQSRRGIYLTTPVCGRTWIQFCSLGFEEANRNLPRSALSPELRQQRPDQDKSPTLPTKPIILAYMHAFVPTYVTYYTSTPKEEGQEIGYLVANKPNSVTIEIWELAFSSITLTDEYVSGPRVIVHHRRTSSSSGVTSR